MMVSWRSWLARLLNNSDLFRSLGLTEEVAGSNPAEIILFASCNSKVLPGEMSTEVRFTRCTYGRADMATRLFLSFLTRFAPTSSDSTLNLTWPANAQDAHWL